MTISAYFTGKWFIAGTSYSDAHQNDIVETHDKSLSLVFFQARFVGIDFEI